MTRRGFRRLLAASLAAGLLVSGATGVSAQASDVALPGGTVVALPLASTGGYATPEAVVAAGTQLRFTNLDLTQHDVTSVARDEDHQPVFQSDLVGFGGSVPVGGTETLAPGAYDFFCSIHPGMTGTLRVVGAASSGEAADDIFSAPEAHGPVGLGESVAYELATSGGDVEVRAVVRTIDGAAVDGDPATGPEGVVSVPDEEALALEGVAPHQVGDIALQESSDGASIGEVPLRAKRLEAEHGDRIAGTFDTGAADDPFGGGEALDVRGPGGTISLGTVDLAEVSSIALRAAAPAASACHPSYEGGPSTYCRAGTALVTSGTPSGPLLAAIDIPGTNPDRPWIRTVSEPLRYHPDGPAEVFVTFVPAVPVPDEVFARVNYLELNGSGVAEPHAFPPDPAGTVSLFDGSSLDGWNMAGTGWFELEDDGSMRTVGGYGLLWHERVFDDFTLRLEFKADSPDANSGVFVRFPDPQGSALEPSDTGYEVQIQDYGQAYFGSADHSQTGAIYSFQAADRVNTRTVGEWNTLEVEAVGHDYRVTLNGRLVTVFEGDRRLQGHIGVQNHDPSGTVWFRDIRVIEG